MFCSDDSERERELRSQECFGTVARCNFCVVGYGVMEGMAYTTERRRRGRLRI